MDQKRLQVPEHFVTTDGARFRVNGRPFRFVGANVAVMYRDEDRRQFATTLQEVASDGVKVVRVWAHGEGGEDSAVRSLDKNTEDWPRNHPFRFGPDQWNEEAFVHLDKVVAEAAKNHLYVQLCLSNWWRDTGGVAQYSEWAKIEGAADDKAPYGINVEKALAFYSNSDTKAWYKAHVERVVQRRNTITGVLYADDPTIMAWELMNEAQAPTGRWGERKAWVEEMSAFIRSLDPNHLITSGAWGYRNAVERRHWLEEHELPTIDFVDVHHYSQHDLDTFVDSPDALKVFLANRVAGAYALGKPLVIGEFGMNHGGYNNSSPEEWYRALFTHSAQLGVAGAMYWIFTPDHKRRKSVSYTTTRDKAMRGEIKRGAELMEKLQEEGFPEELKHPAQHLIPYLFIEEKSPDDPQTKPTSQPGQGVLSYRFQPDAVLRSKFERLGGGDGYIYGVGMGSFEFVVPASEARPIRAIVIRAALLPVEPWDGQGRIKQSDVTLFVNDQDCGSRLVRPSDSGQASMYEWLIDSAPLCSRASLGGALSVRFEVLPLAESPYGVVIAGDVVVELKLG